MKTKSKKPNQEIGKPQGKWEKIPKVSSLYRYRPSGIFFMVARINKRLVWESLKTADLATAKRKVGDTKRKRRNIKGGNISFVNLAGEYPNPEIQGYFPKLTKSYISASCGFMGKKSMVQFTADEAAGCSGAGLFDENGRVVGVVTAMLDKSQDDEDLPADVSFATKSGSFYAEVSKHLPIPIKNISARSRNSVIKTATRSSVLVLAVD